MSNEESVRKLCLRITAENDPIELQRLFDLLGTVLQAKQDEVHLPPMLLPTCARVHTSSRAA